MVVVNHHGAIVQMHKTIPATMVTTRYLGFKRRQRWRAMTVATSRDGGDDGVEA